MSRRVSSASAAIVLGLGSVLIVAGLVTVNMAAGTEADARPVYTMWDGIHRWCPSGNTQLPGILAGDVCYPEALLGFFGWVYSGMALFVIGSVLVLSRLHALLSAASLRWAAVKALALGAVAALLLLDAVQIANARCCSLSPRAVPIFDAYDAFPGATAILSLAALISLALTYSILQRMVAEKRLWPGITARWWPAALAGGALTAAGVVLINFASVCYRNGLFGNDGDSCWPLPSAPYSEAYVSVVVFAFGVLVVTGTSLAVPVSRWPWLIPRAVAFLLLATAGGAAWITLLVRKVCIFCSISFPPDTSPAFDIAGLVVAFGFWACLAFGLATVVSRWRPFRPDAAQTSRHRAAR